MPILKSVFTIFIVASLAVQITAHSRVVKREILIPWSSKNVGSDVAYEPAFDRVEFILNHLGFYGHYVDLNKMSLPDAASKEFRDRYAGVLSFFTSESSRYADKWLNFIEKLPGSDVPLIVFANFGFLDYENKKRLQKIFAGFGVDFSTDNSNRLYVEKLEADKGKMEFERLMPPFVSYWPPLFAPDATDWLKVNFAKDTAASIVFTSKKISVAYGNFGLFTSRDGKHQWQIDPFQFIREALAVPALMAFPDSNVLNGRRVAFSHIDGDAFHSRSLYKPTHYCGQVILEEVLQKYSDLPFGVSYVAAEVSPAHEGNEVTYQTARDIMKLDNVQAASHTFYHPLFWRKEVVAYQQGKVKYSLEREVTGAIDFIAKHFLTDKKIRSLYWSGDCKPGEQALALLEERGFINMNGGDSRFDEKYPSISYLSPLGRPVGRFFQVYSGNANENLYTNLWRGPFNGFKQVIETFKRTGGERILKPINPYYHFYSGERKVALDALHEIYDYLLQQRIASVFPDAYIHSVNAWRRLRISVGSDYLHFKNKEKLFSLRIRSKSVIPDLDRSTGVIGFNRLADSTYVHLAEGIDEARLYYRKTPNVRPYLVSAGGRIAGYRSGKGFVEMTLMPFLRDSVELKLPGVKKASVMLDGRTEKVDVKNDRLTVPVQVSPKSQKLKVTF